MSTIIGEREIRNLPLDSLVVGKGQVRVRDAGKEIDDLAASIAKVGLLEPIVVCPGDKEGTWEILTGQRRFLAHKKLGKSTIAAVILEDRISERDAKVISLTENLVRLDPNRRDLIDACTALYKQYGSMKDVAAETGLPYSKVRDYVKYDRLQPELKKLVDTGEAELAAALKAQDAATATGEYKSEEAIQLAKEMSTMSGAQQKRIVQVIETNPEKPVSDVVEEAKSGEKLTQIIVTLGAEAHRALQKFASEEQVTQDDAAADLITDGLTTKGYLAEA